MGGFIKVDAKKLPTKGLNMQINKEVFHNFKVKCKEKGYPLNVVIETFMNQYGNGRYTFDEETILKWKGDTRDTETLNGSVNKDVYDKFKYTVKKDGFFIRHVLTAFIEDYANNDLIMEFNKE